MFRLVLRFITLGSITALALFATACNSDAQPAGNGLGAALSGPPVIDSVTGARLPRNCSKLTHKPSASEAAALVQCADEMQFSSRIVLYQKVQVEFGKSRPYSAQTDALLTDADIGSAVIPIRGSQQMYTCSTPSSFDNDAGVNCRVDPEPAATGMCWKTSFGDWTCKMTQISGGPPTLQRQSPPKTY